MVEITGGGGIDRNAVLELLFNLTGASTDNGAGLKYSMISDNTEVS